MEKSIEQVERNVSASFGYVKKDMLMLNDAFSSLNDKVQQLSNHVTLLLEEMKSVKEGSAKTPVRKEDKKATEKVKKAAKALK